MIPRSEEVNWTRRLLRAAFWVTRTLGASGLEPDIARAHWSSLPLAGEVDLTELQAAQDGLLAARLLSTKNGRLVPAPELEAACTPERPVPFEFLLAIILESTAPLWLLTAGATGASITEELIPGDIADSLATIIEDPARREAFLLARARTVDAHDRAKLGRGGEEALVRECKNELQALDAEELSDQVRRVSEVSDELGYDVVAPRLNGSLRRLEVKTTTSTAPSVYVFLSRNEFETGRSDPDWYLVVVRDQRDGNYLVLGHSRTDSFAELMPLDRDGAGRWNAARLRLPLSSLCPGLPPAAG